MTALLAYFSPGPWEMMIVGIVALLLFGKRLPEVARSLGRGIVEFKKGMQGIEDEIDRAVYSDTYTQPTTRPAPQDHTDEATAPKFEPPSSEPQQQQTASDDEPTTDVEMG